MRAQGWDIDLLAHHRRGGHILGLCGGYQMLGTEIVDPDGIEGAPGSAGGLGLLDVKTTMTGDKRLTEATATHAQSSATFTGYEMHKGRTDGPDCARPFAQMADRAEGATSADGRITGSYLHGMFRDDAFRRSFLEALGAETSALSYDTTVEATLDALAQHMETHLDLDRLFALAR